MSRTLSIRLQNISRAYYDINKKPWNWTWLGHSLCVNLGSITLETWLPHITLSRKDTFSKDLWGFKEKNSLTSLNWLTRHLLYSIMSIGSGHSNGKAQVQEMYTYAKVSIYLLVWRNVMCPGHLRSLSGTSWPLKKWVRLDNLDLAESSSRR